MKIYRIAAMAGILLAMASCRNKAALPPQPVITVSIEPQRWLLEQIVGDKMEVRTLLARGGNPETYEPAFSHLAALERSQAYLCIGGLGFEEAIIRRVRSNNPNLLIESVSDSISRIESAHGGHSHGLDPHVWSSVANGRLIAENMLHIVCRIDPANAQTYTDNFVNLSRRIDSVGAVCDSLLAPMRGSVFVVWHPSLSYFARDYGLEQLALGSEGKELTVNETRALIDHIKDSGAHTFLVQKDFDSGRVASIAGSDTAISIVSIDPLNYEWDAELIATARAIARR